MNSDLEAAHKARAAASDPQLITDETVDATARCMAAAFDDDPVVSWFVRADQYHDAAMFSMMQSNVKRAMVQGWGFCSSDAKCAAIWFPPDEDHTSLGFFDRLKLMQRLSKLTGLARLHRIVALISEMDKAHPKAPHYYLQVLGVDPAHQGVGLGSCILTATLAKTDAEGLPCYLENSKPQNTPFYERHGFKVMNELKITAKGPTMWPMWRQVGGG